MDTCNDDSYSFPTPPFEEFERQNQSVSTMSQDTHSPHISVRTKDSVAKDSYSVANLNLGRGAHLNEFSRQLLMQPDLRSETTVLQEFRMPQFSSIITEQSCSIEDDRREIFPVPHAMTTQADEPFQSQRPRLNSQNTTSSITDLCILNSGATNLSEGVLTISQRPRHRTRRRNRAMDSSQFDGILDQVFVE